ncbi:MAG: hypothetical protein J5988_01800, partial [Eubacterium sp.]|nr:hypothetical protein [Eubacterium sp.]
MRKIKTGSMLCQIREQKKISQKKLCAGVCSVATLSKYECGERTPDGLLFFFFMQRMGMAPDDFAVMLSDEEFQYYKWKEAIFTAIQSGEWARVEELFHSMEAENRDCNSKIQNQFYFYVSAVYAEKIEKNQKKAIQFLEKAVRETVPDFLESRLTEYQLSTMEIGLMAIYFYKGGQQNFIESNEIYRNQYSLLSYVRKEIYDKREASRLIPGIACVLLRCCGNQMNVWERLEIEEEAVELLGRFPFLLGGHIALRALRGDLNAVAAALAVAQDHDLAALVGLLPLLVVIQTDFYFFAQQIDSGHVAGAVGGVDKGVVLGHALDGVLIGVLFILETAHQSAAGAGDFGGVEAQVLGLCHFNGHGDELVQKLATAERTAANTDTAQHFCLVPDAHLAKLNAGAE